MCHSLLASRHDLGGNEGPGGMAKVQFGGLLEAHVFIDAIARVFVVQPYTRGGGVTGQGAESQRYD